MRGHELVNRLIVLSVMAILCQSASAGGTTDMAKYMPGDTAVYVGWSPWLEKDAPELKTERQFLEAALAMLAEKTDDEKAASLSALLDPLLTLQTAAGGIGLFDVTMNEETPDIQAALVVGAGADSPKFAEATRKIAALVAEKAEIESHSVKDVRLERVRLGDSPLYLVWGLHKDCFLLALGDTAAGKIIDCMNGQGQSLADAAEFKFDRQKVVAKSDARFVCLYADVQRVITRAKELVKELHGPLPPTVDAALEQLGLTALRSGYIHCDEVSGQPRTMAFAHVTGALRGLLKLWDQKTLTDDDLKIVPKDAYWAAVGNLDLAGMWTETRRVIGELAPDALPMVDGALAAGKEILGFSITDDLLPAFGDSWALFDAPDHGGILLTGTVLVAEVRDAEKLQSVLTRLVQMADPFARQAKFTLQVKETKYGGHTINYLLVGGAPSPVAPAWGFVDGRWVFGLFPQTVAVALKQVDPKTRGESLPDHPGFKAARALLPKQVQSVSYFDAKYFARMFYPFMNALQTLGVSMLGKHGVEIDLNLMPPIAEATAKATVYVGTCSTDADGILYASVGGGAPRIMAAAAATSMATSILLPSVARAREVAKRAVSATNLRGIGLACLIYARDNQGKFPASVDMLLKEGLLTQKQIHSPRDSDADENSVSYVYLAGQTQSAAPQNVLAYEQVFGNEGTSVLFVDGHVQWMKIKEFRGAVRETYKRLGRENEVPREFGAGDSD